MYWMISANGKMYDHANAFQKWGYVDWRQNANYKIGDIVYIYCTKPYKKIKYKTKVLSCNMNFYECKEDREFWIDIKAYEESQSGRYARLKLIEQVDSDFLSLEKLKEHGLNAPPQGPIKVIKDELKEYIDLYMHDLVDENIFPETDILKITKEGAVISVKVNKYERSTIARQECIKYHGTTCKICGFDFKEHYGELGESFIHVHHILPINEVGEEYIIDYKRDLIPVCPNCHAMLHKKNIDGKTVSIKELQRIVSNKMIKGNKDESI